MVQTSNLFFPRPGKSKRLRLPICLFPGPGKSKIASDFQFAFSQPGKKQSEVWRAIVLAAWPGHQHDLRRPFAGPSRTFRDCSESTLEISLWNSITNKEEVGFWTTLIYIYIYIRRECLRPQCIWPLPLCIFAWYLMVFTHLWWSPSHQGHFCAVGVRPCCALSSGFCWITWNYDRQKAYVSWKVRQHCYRCHNVVMDVTTLSSIGSTSTAGGCEPPCLMWWPVCSFWQTTGSEIKSLRWSTSHFAGRRQTGRTLSGDPPRNNRRAKEHIPSKKPCDFYKRPGV